MATTYEIGVIPGDGIGPELVGCTRDVLGAVAAGQGGFELSFTEESGGAAHYLAHGRALDADALERMRAHYEAVLKGPVGLPDARFPDGTEAGLLGGVLRQGLDTFANLRPVRLLAGIAAPVTHAVGEIDYLIVRENTEGLYASRGNGVGNRWAASDILFVTRPGTERIVRTAFEQCRLRSGAPADGVRRVTCVDKSNVLKSMVLFREIFDEVAAEYPDIEADHLYVDAAAQALVAQPAQFDVIVTENLMGDILSDLGGGTIGGIGLCPSANIGEASAYFEPIHGSAPALAGRNEANPIGQILSAALMLDHLGEREAGERLRAAVAAACADGFGELTPDGRVRWGTDRLTAAIVERL